METVKLIECPRDAWQGLPRQIPTERKVEYLRALVAAGFAHIDAVSFVSPKAVPQMADSEEVLKQLGADRGRGDHRHRRERERRGARDRDRRGQHAGISVFDFGDFLAAESESIARGKSRRLCRRSAQRAREAGLEMVAYISMAFGNPYDDPWSEEQVADGGRVHQRARDCCVSLADTVGTAKPELVQRVVAAVGDGCRRLRGRRASAQHASGRGAKILAAYDAGCRRFDAAIGGLGGCPFAQDDLIGNIPTEEVVQALEQRGVTLPFAASLPQLGELSARIGAEFGATQSGTS